MTKNELLHLGIKFDVDDKDLKVSKQDLNDIIKELDKISTKGINQEFKFGNEIKNATTYAQELKKILEDSWNSRLGQLDLNRFNNELIKSGLSVNNLKTDLSQMGISGIDSFNRLASSILNTNIELKRSSTFLDKMALTMANTFRFSISSSVINNLTGQISKAYNYSKDLDKSLNDIRIVSGQSADQMERFAKYANEAAKSTGATTLDYTDAALIYYQQGLSEEEVKKRTNITIKAANVLGDSADEVSNYLTAIWNNFAKGSENLEYFADVLAKLGAETASSAEEISQGLEKFAAVGETVGLSYEYAAAALTTVTDRTRQSADVVGTAFKTLFARLQGLKLGETLEDETDLNKYSKALAAVGIDIKDQTGNLKDMDDILDEMGSKWQTLSKDQQVALAQTVAGVRQYTQLVALMDNWDFFIKNVDRAKNATGALQEQQNIYMDSVEAHLNKIRIEAEKAYDILFDTKSVNNFYDAVSKVLELLNSFLGGLGGGLNTLSFFGLGATNLLSKQIGGFFERKYENAEIGQAAKVQGNLTEAIRQQITEKYAKSGYDVEGDKALQDRIKIETENSEKIYSIRNQITEQRQKELIILQSQIGKEKEELSNLQQYAEIAKSVYQNEDPNKWLSGAEDTLKNWKKDVDKKNTAKTYLTTELKDFIGNLRDDDLMKLGPTDRKEWIADFKENWKETLLPKGTAVKFSEEVSKEMSNMLNDLDNIGGDIDENFEKRIFNLGVKLNNEIQEQIIDPVQNKINILQEAVNRKKILNVEGPKKEKFIQSGNAEIDEEKEKRDRESAIANLVSILSIAGQVGIVFTGINKTIDQMTKGTISFEEGWKNILTTILSSSLMILPRLKNIKGFLKDIPVLLKAIAVSQGFITKEAELTATVVASLVTELLFVAGIVAGIAAIGITLYKNYNKTAEAVRETGNQFSILSDHLQKCKEAASELKNNISEYDEGLIALQKLTQGTNEYKQALQNANQKAEELIQKYGLLVGTDYTIDSNGLIRIQTGEESSLWEKQRQLNEQNNNLAQQEFAASIRASQTSIAKQQLDLQRQSGINRNSDIEKQYENLIVSMAASGLFSLPSLLLATGGVLARESSEKRGYNLTNSEINEVYDALTKEGINYASILEQSEDNVKEWILNNENLSQNTKDNADVIAKNKNAIEKYVSGVEEATKKLNRINQEMVVSHIKENQILSSTISEMSKDNNGQTNDNTQQLIQQAIAASTAGQNLAQVEYNKVTEIKNKTSQIKSNADLEKYAKENNLIGLTNINDENLTKQYLKNVLQYSDEDLAHVNIKNDWGKTTTSWASNYIDSKGISHTSNENIYSELNDEEARRAVAFNMEVEKLSQNMDNSANEILGDTTQAIQSMLQSTSELSNKLKINIGNIILNSMAGRDKEGNNALFNFEEAFETLTDTQIDTLIGYSSEELAEALHLTEEDFSQLGYQSAEAFEKAFDKALYEKERKALLQLMQDIQSYGNAENLSDEDYNNLATNLGKQLNAEEMSDLSSRSLALKQINFQDDDIENQINQIKNLAKSIKEAKKENVSLTDAQKEEAKELKYSEDALKLYSKELQKNNKGLENNEEAATNVALANIKMNQGIANLASNWDKWNKVLQDHNTNSGEYYEVLSQLKSTMEDIVGVDLSTDFLLNEENMQKMQELAQGNTEAFDELHNAAMQDYILHLGIVGPNQEAIDGVRDTLLDMVNDIESQSDIEIGTNLDPSYVDQLNEMLEKGQITADQANKILAGIGYSPIVSYITEERTTKTKHQVSAELFGQEVPIGTVYDTATATVQVPQIQGGSEGGEGPKYVGRPTSKNIDYSNTSGGRSSGGGGGGGSKAKEPNKIDPVEEQADRYHQVNTQITKVDNSLKKLTSQEKKFVGAKLIDNLNKQWALLNTQVENYNEKLRIAQDESAELRDKLAGKGTQFNADGTISNYMEVYAAQEAYINSLIDNYNNMSAEEQESYKEVVEQAKEDFKEFQKDLDRYDTLISNEIPQLAQSIQDAIDKQIELNIKKFNMEVDITLNFSEAERDWNAWKARVMDGIKEDDILGNAKARLEDFSTYYNDAATASIQVQTRHLEDTLAELRKMDQGLDNVYGDNRTQALEDLQKYYKQLMEDLKGVLELQEEIHKKYLDMMDEVSDKMKEQIDKYEMVTELLENNMKIVQLVYGEQAYHQLDNFYQQQYNNNLAQLDFLRQQKELWADQMEMFEEGSDEWDAAKEKWMDATKELSKALEDALNDAREAFENTVNGIMQDLNNKVTNDLGLDYVQEEWDLINKNADEYLDDINAIAGIHSLEKKYVDAINDSSNPKNQQRIKALMDSELGTLKSMDKISEKDLERANKKYQIALAQLALEDAQANKTRMRLRRDSQGNYRYQYVADKEAIDKAKEELENLYVDLYNFDKEKYNETLNQILSIWNEFQQKMAEAALINDPEQREQRELLLRRYYGELITAETDKNLAYQKELEESAYMTKAQQYQDDLFNFKNMTQEERDTLLNEVGGAFGELLEVYGVNSEAFKNMTEEEQQAVIDNLGDAFGKLSGFYNEDKERFDKLEEDNVNTLVEKLVPGWNSAIQHMSDTIVGDGGFEPTIKDAMDNIADATDNYETQLDELATAADKDTEVIAQGLDDDIDKTKELIKDNEELIDSFEDSLDALKDVCDWVDNLTNKYAQNEAAAKAAAKAAHDYWTQEQKRQAEDAKKQNQTSSNAGSSNDNNSGNNNGANVAAAAAPSASQGSQGNGQLDIGDDAIYTHGSYYADSYGGGRAGNRGIGGEVTVTDIRDDGRPYPIHVVSDDSAYGWLREDQLEGYKSGGYTGEWDSENGRLAMLHQKELVLNAHDTENMLNTVAIMRQLATSLGENVLSRLAGVAARSQNGNDNTSALEQNVHIDATFPNVRDAKEIENALNNLVNSASQRIYDKKR